MKPTVAFVTGASGFVGSHLVRRLLDDGLEVHALRRPQSTDWRLAMRDARLHRHDASLLDREELAGVIVAVKPHLMFHLAAATVVAGAVGSVEELVRVNVSGAINLIEACNAVDYSALVLTGDSFEYGASVDPLREDDQRRPDTVHGLSKLSATLFGQAVALDTGRPIVTLRLFSTYGPHDNPRRLVPRLIAGARSHTPIPLSRPQIARDWVYVADVIDLYIEAARKAPTLSGQVFNAGSGTSVTIGGMVDAVGRLAGSPIEARWGEFVAPPHDDTPWIADTTRTFGAFDWRPRTTLEEGLSRTIAAAVAERTT